MLLKRFSKLSLEWKIIIYDFLLIVIPFIMLELIHFFPLVLKDNLFNLFFFLSSLIFIGIFIFINIKIFNGIFSEKSLEMGAIISHYLLTFIAIVSFFAIIFGNPHGFNRIINSNNGSEYINFYVINEGNKDILFEPFYYSASTLMGGGYGDYIPQGFLFRYYSIFLMFFGWFVFLILFSQTISFLINKEMNKHKRN